MNPLTNETVDAVELTWQTCLGVHANGFPLEHGNCFSVRTSPTGHYRIVNFVLENLEELLRRGTVTFPLKVLPLNENVAVLHDPRIENNWYQERFCSTCCPRELLPAPQRLEELRAIQRGEREELENGIVYINFAKAKK